MKTVECLFIILRRGDTSFEIGTGILVGVFMVIVFLIYNIVKKRKRNN